MDKEIRKAIVFAKIKTLSCFNKPYVNHNIIPNINIIKIAAEYAIRSIYIYNY